MVTMFFMLGSEDNRVLFEEFGTISWFYSFRDVT